MRTKAKYKRKAKISAGTINNSSFGHGGVVPGAGKLIAPEDRTTPSGNVGAGSVALADSELPGLEPAAVSVTDSKLNPEYVETAVQLATAEKELKRWDGEVTEALDNVNHFRSEVIRLRKLFYVQTRDIVELHVAG